MVVEHQRGVAARANSVINGGEGVAAGHLFGGAVGAERPEHFHGFAAVGGSQAHVHALVPFAVHPAGVQQQHGLAQGRVALQLLHFGVELKFAVLLHHGHGHAHHAQQPQTQQRQAHRAGNQRAAEQQVQPAQQQGQGRDGEGKKARQ